MLAPCNDLIKIVAICDSGAGQKQQHFSQRIRNPPWLPAIRKLAVVELADEHALAFFRPLSLSNVPGQSLETQIATGCVEFRLSRLLEPDHTPVGANEAK